MIEWSPSGDTAIICGGVWVWEIVDGIRRVYHVLKHWEDPRQTDLYSNGVYSINPIEPLANGIVPKGINFALSAADAAWLNAQRIAAYDAGNTPLNNLKSYSITNKQELSSITLAPGMKINTQLKNQQGTVLAQLEVPLRPADQQIITPDMIICIDFEN